MHLQSGLTAGFTGPARVWWTHTDNSHSIPALETEDVAYDVIVSAETIGPIQVTARLRARAFPPRFLRALAAGRPDLVNEIMVDRNRIVEMVSAPPATIQVQQAD